MNKENLCKIIMLSALLATGGCSSVPPQSGLEAKGRPILSADEAQSMIKITVTQSVPAESADSIVASNND